MKLTSNAAILAFALSAVSSTGWAADQSLPEHRGFVRMPSFTQADKDGSGAIELSEAQGIEGLDFTSADSDHDGKLSRSEYEATAGRGGTVPADTSPSGGPNPATPGGSRY